jgi:hypothetical protein
MNQGQLIDFVKVKGRFHRSVRLRFDFETGQGQDGYILTDTATELAVRILEALRDPKAPRAWSITGPYGTGKSSFALFLARVLSGKKNRGNPASHFRAEHNVHAQPFLCALVEGQRGSLGKAILQALSEAVAQWDVKPSITKRIRAAVRSDTPDTEVVISLCRELSDSINRSKVGGVLVIIDELGKFLEYASLHPEVEDLHLMQGLAEVAARSQAPFLLVTVLHTAFTSYLPIADHVRRSEWAKIQGRFQDVVFLEPVEQILRLVGESLEKDFPKAIARGFDRVAKETLKSKALAEARRRVNLDDLAFRCLPLHPIAALLLWPLFRSQLAQNERSLFSFLTSHEPFGFQDFLAKASSEGEPQLYTVDRLFDYASSSFGHALFHGSVARRWAEVTQALDRVRTDAPSLATEVLKTAGLLLLYGDSVGLRADDETLFASLPNRKGVRKAIDFLVEASILVYRRHQHSYALWEGSDVDVDALYKTGLAKVEGSGFATLVQDTLELWPFLARKHYFETGTLRAFDVEVLEGSEQALLDSLQNGQHVRDGRIVFVLAKTQYARKKLMELAKEVTSDLDSETLKPTIFAFPRPLAGLESALAEVQAWKWAIANTIALESDRVARMEILSRLSFAKDQLGAVAGETLGLRGHAFRPELSTWVCSGEHLTFGSGQHFLEWLSDLCDRIYHDAPPIRNELINRDKLSSAAAAARNGLMRAMLLNPHETRLGFEGTPPEVSMYETLLRDSGFHCQRDNRYEFSVPKDAWKPVWRAVKAFLRTTQKHRRPVLELFDQLKQPPFGLRDGVLPIILLLALLVDSDDVALYAQDGAFVPELRDEVLELLVRNPGDFEVQRFGSDHARKRVLAEVAKVLGKTGTSTESQETALLDVVKPLVVFAARLPQFTKNTKKLDAKAVGLRDTLLKARDPQELLFTDIPKALGIKRESKASPQALAEELEKAIRGLRRAYPNLLDEIEQELSKTLGLGGNSAQAKEQLRKRAEAVVPYAAEQTLSLFAREATRISNRDWREVLGRVVQKGLPPDRWTDNDAMEFQMRLQQLRSDFLRLEELVAEKGGMPAGRIVRVGLLDGSYEEIREILSIAPELEPAVEDLKDRIVDQLDCASAQPGGAEEIRVAALARALAREIERKHNRANG